MIQKKICLLGSFAVGKTSLIQQHINSVFSDKYLTTVGVKIDKAEFDIDGEQLSLMIWDIAGEDDFTSIRPAYLRGLDGYIIVVDGSRETTVHKALSIHQNVVDSCGEIPVIFAVNKADIKHEWEVTEDQLSQLKRTGYPVFETSAKSGQSVDSIFSNLGVQLLQHHG